MSPEEVQEHVDFINNMSQFEMAQMWRHTSPGHIYFDCALPFYNIFKKRFNDLGGFTPEISKRIEWD